LKSNPVNQFPKIANGKTAFLNNEDVSFDHEFDIKIIGKAKEILQELNARVK